MKTKLDYFIDLLKDMNQHNQSLLSKFSGEMSNDFVAKTTQLRDDLMIAEHIRDTHLKDLNALPDRGGCNPNPKPRKHRED